jgi:HEAT repeat protein
MDWTQWSLWWRFNCHPYLDLKRHVQTGGVVTGSDDFFLGRGQTLARDILRPSDATLESEVVPLLLELLKNERSNDVLSAAAIALGKVGAATGDGRREVQALKPLLRHANQEVAETAAVSLGILGRESSIDLLLALLQGDAESLRERHWVDLGREVPHRTRAFAAYGLALVGREASGYDRMRIVAGLHSVLRDEALDRPQQDLAVACVLALGQVPLPVRPGSSASPDRVTTVLTSRQEQVDALLDLLRDVRLDERIRAHVPPAAAALVADEPEQLEARRRATRRFLARLEDRGEEREVRQGCAVALGLLADADEDALDAKVRTALQRATGSDPDQHVRRFALIALGRIGGRAGQGEGDPVAAAAEVRAHLTKALAGGSSQLRPWAGLALAVLERGAASERRPTSPDALRALRAALDDAGSPEELGGMAIACGIARDPEAVPLLLKKLETVSEPGARGYVCLALGMIGAGRAIVPIQELVRESRYQPVLIERAATALGLLGDKSAVPDLVALLSSSGSLSAQASVASALGTIGDARALEPLIALAEDPTKTDLARAFAVVALGRVADGDTLPWNAWLSVDANFPAAPPTLTEPLSGTGVLDIL